MKKKFSLFISYYILSWFLSNFAIAQSQALQISDAWIRQAPPGVMMLGGYLQIKNQTDQPLSIKTLTSPLFKKIEIHKTLNENGLSRMMHVPNLTIPPNEQVALVPGNMHLMIMHPTRALQVDEMVLINIELENGDLMSFEAQVKK